MTRTFLILLTTLLLTSCFSSTKDEDNFFGKWDLEFADLKTVIDLNSDEIPNKKNRQEILKDNQLIFNEDSTYFLVFGKTQQVSFGKWEHQENKITLIPTDQTLDVWEFTIEQKSSNKMTTLINYTTSPKKGFNELFVYNFLEYRRKDDKFSESPFRDYASSTKNLWRVKPTAPESEIEIKTRVSNALDFTLSYLKYGENNSDERRKTRVSLLVIKNIPFFFAGNGVQLEQNEEWEKVFYNTDDAQTAYSLLQDAFRQIKDLYIPDEYNNKPLGLNIFIIENIKKAIDGEY